MSDISINNLSSGNELGNGCSSVSGDYSKLKKEYEVFRKKAKKSDMANSLTLKEKELELIMQLKAAARAEGISDDIPEIMSREMELKAALNDGVVPISPHEIMYYSPVKKSPDFINMSKTYSIYDDLVRNADENTKKIIDADLQLMSGLGIDMDSSINLLDVIKCTDAQTGKNTINQDTFKKLADVKKILSTSRRNETDEYNSPINQIGVQKFSYGTNTIIFKNGKAAYISPVYERSVQSKIGRAHV